MADKNKKRNNNRNKDYDDDFNPKFKKMKKKVCPLCGDKNFVLDFKNSDQLRKFVNDKGKILPRRTFKIFLVKLSPVLFAKVTASNNCSLKFS